MSISSNQDKNCQPDGFSVLSSTTPDVAAPGISLFAGTSSHQLLDELAEMDHEEVDANLLLFVERQLQEKETAELRAKIFQAEQEIAKQAVDLKRSMEECHAAQLEKTNIESRQGEILRQYKKLIDDAEINQKRKDLAYLFGRVCDKAEERLLRNPEFVKLFEETKTCHAFILVLDIRRSTELMLRATTPQDYARFLDGLMNRLVRIIKNHFGIIDKFTGDGLLAYFPVFYSGTDAGYLALAAARDCHAAFANHYRAERERFTVSFAEAGLGIGIDCGEVHLLRITGELTVVGTPVVYASRMASADAGHTYMNHRATSELNRQGVPIRQSETAVPMKHEGAILAYDVALTDSKFTPTAPEWLIAPS